MATQVLHTQTETYIYLYIPSPQQNGYPHALSALLFQYFPETIVGPDTQLRT